MAEAQALASPVCAPHRQIDPHTFSEPQITHPANGFLQFNI
jgi:hypothetical protein